MHGLLANFADLLSFVNHLLIFQKFSGDHDCRTEDAGPAACSSGVLQFICIR